MRPTGTRTATRTAGKKGGTRAQDRSTDAARRAWRKRVESQRSPPVRGHWRIAPHQARKGVLNANQHALADALGRPMTFFLTVRQITDAIGAWALGLSAKGKDAPRRTRLGCGLVPQALARASHHPLHPGADPLNPAGLQAVRTSSPASRPGRREWCLSKTTPRLTKNASGS